MEHEWVTQKAGATGKKWWWCVKCHSSTFSSDNPESSSRGEKYIDGKVMFLTCLEGQVYMTMKE